MLKKNIMLKIFIFLNFFLFLASCTYQYTNENNPGTGAVNKIYLNVKSFEINKDSLEIIKTDNSLQNEINKKVLKKLEAWAWKKFFIKGNENTANLYFLKVDTKLIKKSKNKKTMISIFQQGKQTYNTSLNFDLSISANDSLIKTLKVSSNLDFALLNNFSITQRDKVIDYNINKLIKLIDKKVTDQLSKEAFTQFLIK